MIEVAKQNYLYSNLKMLLISAPASSEVIYISKIGNYSAV
jgi:hypothetical protein